MIFAQHWGFLGQKTASELFSAAANGAVHSGSMGLLLSTATHQTLIKLFFVFTTDAVLEQTPIGCVGLLNRLLH